MRAAAWDRLRKELRGAPARDLARYTADLLCLIDDEGVRGAFFPAATCEQQSHRRGRGMFRRSRRSRAPTPISCAPVGMRAGDVPRHARRAPGAVAGFACLAAPGGVSPRLIDRDPPAARRRAHLRSDPIPRGERALFLRWIAGSCGSAVSALILDVTRTCMEMRPELRRVYAAPPT